MKIVFGKQLWVGKGFHLANKKSLVLGDRCALGAFIVLANHGKVEIGDDFIAAPGLTLDSGSHVPSTMEPYSEPIIIGHRVWCDGNVTTLPGVTIGNDIVIGAGGVVNRSIPPNSIAVGVPAKVLKPLERNNIAELWSWTR